jgi:dCMP deaminase
MIKPFKDKYHPLYWATAYAAADQSVCKKRKVGAVVVAPSGMLSVGWNGMPSGFNGPPETLKEEKFLDIHKSIYTTNPEVVHAERNAIDKMTRQGVSTEGSIIFTTAAPCLECAKSIHGAGFREVYYKQVTTNGRAGLDFLFEAGIPTMRLDDE